MGQNPGVKPVTAGFQPAVRETIKTDRTRARPASGPSFRGHPGRRMRGRHLAAHERGGSRDRSAATPVGLVAPGEVQYHVGPFFTPSAPCASEPDVSRFVFALPEPLTPGRFTG